jgi:hypothetical protein
MYPWKISIGVLPDCVAGATTFFNASMSALNRLTCSTTSGGTAPASVCVDVRDPPPASPSTAHTAELTAIAIIRRCSPIVPRLASSAKSSIVRSNSIVGINPIAFRMRVKSGFRCCKSSNPFTYAALYGTNSISDDDPTRDTTILPVPKYGSPDPTPR